MKKTVDLTILGALLDAEGYKDGDRQILFGYVTKWFPEPEEGKDPYGMILATGIEIGCRISHRFIPPVGHNGVPSTLRAPKVGDYVFVVPFWPPKAASKRPYAATWGLVEELDPSVMKAETLLDYLLHALNKWWWSRKTQKQTPRAS